ncbi:MAG: HAMP domain-containing sensor histidine kinase [Myxococcota bacterium]
MRKLPLAVALGLGLLALAWGLVWLQGIFLEERDEALAEVAARRRALEQFALVELEQRLKSRLDEARPTIDGAREDALLPAGTFLLYDRGTLVLPRASRPRPGLDTPVTERYRRLATAAPRPARDGDPATSTEDDPYDQRTRILDDLRVALDDGDRSATERAVRDLLGHRAAFVLPADRDLPTLLVALDRLSRRARPQRSLMVGLLRDGLRGQTSRLDGAQRRLLERVDRFSAPDLRFLADRTIALCEANGVIYRDFAARVDEALARGRGTPTQDVPVLPTPAPDAPTLLDEMRWYVAPSRDDRVYGLQIRLSPLLEEITGAMRTRVLLGPDDAVELGAGRGPTTVSSLPLAIASPTWAAATEAAEARYRLKALLEGVIAVLVFGVAGLGLVIYRRRNRFLALKAEFVSAVSHELRTPLASIRLMAETLERRTKDVPRARDYPARIIRDVDGLTFLVENILSFNRLEGGRWVPRPQSVRLVELVDKLRQERDSWARRPAELEADVAETTLYADPDLLQLVLTNLARNGCQYNDREPARITIAAERPTQGGTLITVRDNGTGIPDGQTERIFDDFHRAGEQTTRGSGLGLAICRKIVDAHGGDIRVRETSEAGTTFALFFPPAPGPVGRQAGS